MLEGLKEVVLKTSEGVDKTLFCQVRVVGKELVARGVRVVFRLGARVVFHFEEHEDGKRVGNSM